MSEFKEFLEHYVEQSLEEAKGRFKSGGYRASRRIVRGKTKSFASTRYMGRHKEQGEDKTHIGASEQGKVGHIDKKEEPTSSVSHTTEVTPFTGKGLDAPIAKSALVPNSSQEGMYVQLTNGKKGVFYTGKVPSDMQHNNSVERAYHVPTALGDFPMHGTMVEVPEPASISSPSSEFTKAEIEQRDHLIKLIKEKHSYTAIAKLLPGVGGIHSKTSVPNLVKKYKLNVDDLRGVVRQKDKAEFQKTHKEERDLLINLFAHNTPYKEIAELMGVPQATINGLAIKHEVSQSAKEVEAARVDLVKKYSDEGKSMEEIAGLFRMDKKDIELFLRHNGITIKNPAEFIEKIDGRPKAEVEREKEIAKKKAAKAKALEKAKAKWQQSPEQVAKAEHEAKLKAEQEVKAKAEREAKLKADREAKLKAEQEIRAKADQEAKAKEAHAAKLKAEKEAKAIEEPKQEPKVERKVKVEVVPDKDLTSDERKQKYEITRELSKGKNIKDLHKSIEGLKTPEDTTIAVKRYGIDTESIRKEFEKRESDQLAELISTGNKKSTIAKNYGITVKQLETKLKKYGISSEGVKDDLLTKEKSDLEHRLKQGYSPDDIANDLGITTKVLKDKLKKHNIDVKSIKAEIDKTKEQEAATQEKERISDQAIKEASMKRRVKDSLEVDISNKMSIADMAAKRGISEDAVHKLIKNYGADVKTATEISKKPLLDKDQVIESYISSGGDTELAGKKLNVSELEFKRTLSTLNKAEYQKPKRTEWSSDVNYMPFNHSSVAKMKGSMDKKKHPEYAAQYERAKKHRGRAEAEIVLSRVMSPKVISELKKLIKDPKNTKLALISSGEYSNNVIPTIFATELSTQLGIPIAEFQKSVEYKRGDKDRIGRLLAPSMVKGKVEEGVNYIMVDDVLTAGGTLASLKGTIENNGGKAIGLTVIGMGMGKKRSLDITPKTTKALEDNFGTDIHDYIEKETGYKISQLTEHEAQGLIEDYGTSKGKSTDQRHNLEKLKKAIDEYWRGEPKYK